MISGYVQIEDVESSSCPLMVMFKGGGRRGRELQLDL